MGCNEDSKEIFSHLRENRMKKNHTHRFRRHTYKSGNKVYFCTLDCTFKIDCQLALGQATICNICGQPFIMSEYALKLKLPHCDKCSKRKIVDSEGNTRFVRSNLVDEVLTSVADDTAKSLSERLKATITVQVDDDI